MLRLLLSVLLVVHTWAVIAAESKRSPGVAPGEKRVALIIGNSAYKAAPLKNPSNDARDMAARLRSLGFDVVERTNLTTRQIASTLREFRSKLAPGAVAVFFYAGHGLQIKGVNYLPTVDADISSEEDVPLQSFDVNKVLELMEESKTRLNLIFLDACRNNPFARSFRSASDGLAKVNAPSGTLISFATRPGSVAADGEGRNGLYTSKLLASMNETNQPIELVLKRVVTGVKAASKGKQEPWMEGSIEGDFCFGICGTLASAAPLDKTDPSPAAIEFSYWESVRDSRDPEVYQTYLNKYPNGQFVDIAKAKIRELSRQAAPSEATGGQAEGVETWKAGNGEIFELKISGDKARLTRLSAGDDILVYNVAFQKYPDAFNLPLEISGRLAGNRFSGEYLQKSVSTEKTNCTTAERRGKVEGTIDRDAGRIHLVYDRVALEYQVEFKSIFSDVFVCDLIGKKAFPGYALELAPHAAR